VKASKQKIQKIKNNPKYKSLVKLALSAINISIPDDILNVLLAIGPAYTIPADLLQNEILGKKVPKCFLKSHHSLLNTCKLHYHSDALHLILIDSDTPPSVAFGFENTAILFFKTKYTDPLVAKRGKTFFPQTYFIADGALLAQVGGSYARSFSVYDFLVTTLSERDHFPLFLFDRVALNSSVTPWSIVYEENAIALIQSPTIPDISLNDIFKYVQGGYVNPEIEGVLRYAERSYRRYYNALEKIYLESVGAMPQSAVKEIIDKGEGGYTSELMILKAVLDEFAFGYVDGNGNELPEPEFIAKHTPNTPDPLWPFIKKYGKIIPTTSPALEHEALARDVIFRASDTLLDAEERAQLREDPNLDELDIRRDLSKKYGLFSTLSANAILRNHPLFSHLLQYVDQLIQQAKQGRAKY